MAAPKKFNTKGRPKQVNFQVDEDLLEDIKVLAARRRLPMSDVIRDAIEAELEREADREVQT